MLTALDLIALAILATYSAAGLVGMRLLLCPRPVAGVLLVVLSAVGIGLLFVMASRYWFGDEPISDPFIKVSLWNLLVTTVGVLVTLASVGIGTFAVASWARSELKRGHWLVALGVPMLLVAVMGSVGTGTLIILSRTGKTVVREAALRSVTVVPGFSISLFVSTGITTPTSLAFGPDGRLYVADLTGRIWAVTTRAGEAATPILVADGFDQPVGIAWRGDDLYVASYQKVTRLEDAAGSPFPLNRHDVVVGLPARLYIWHQNEGLVFGPDGRMYFGVGSTSNASRPTHPLEASVLTANPDGSDLRVYATGLRNVYDLAFNQAGDLFGGDNGPAVIEDGIARAPSDELNHIVDGGDYGFPTTYGDSSPDASIRPPVFLFNPHASPNGITFYHGRTFPREYDDNAFIALWYQGDVYRMELAKTSGGNYLARGTPFARGFLNPLDVTVGPDGCLYVADSGTSAIYRIAAEHTGVGDR